MSPFRYQNIKKVKAWQRNWRFSLVTYGTSPTPQEEGDSVHVHHAGTRAEKRYCFVVCILNDLQILHHRYKLYYVVPHHLKQNFELHTILGYLFWMNESYARMQQFSLAR
jgi:hypothetical protein